MTTSFPPHQNHSTTRISPSQALSLLSKYLEAATTDASLHPNALLTEHGPIIPSSGSNVGLVLHNLKRVEAGLRGEHLAADLTFKTLGEEGILEVAVTGSENAQSTSDGVSKGNGQEMEYEWQDRREFEQEQQIVLGEIGPRDNGVEGRVREGEKVPEVKATNTIEDVTARKRAKKERHKKAKTDRDAKRKLEKDAEK